jgi:hypothetical protein
MRGVSDYSPYFNTASSSAREVSARAGTAEPIGEIPNSEQTATESGFWGEDGFSFSDLIDAVNPLNHIPIVSGLMEQETEHKVSTAAKLIGGALLGGPIGFVVGLIDAVFEQATGKGAAESMVAALMEDSPPNETQVAIAAAPAENNNQHITENAIHAVPIPEVEVVAEQQLPAIRVSPSPLRVGAAQGMSDTSRDLALLDLYGASTPSAHSSYKKAQMLPYLKDVTVSRVL